MVQVGDRVRYNPDWLSEEYAHIEGTVDKILRDEDTDERFAYVTTSPGNPDTELINLSDIGEDGEYEVVQDDE